MKKFCEFVIVSSILAGVVLGTNLTSKIAKVKANAHSKTAVQLEFSEEKERTIPLDKQFNPLKGVSLVSSNGKVSSDTQYFVVFDGHGHYIFEDGTTTLKALTNNKPEIKATARVILKGTSFKPLKHAKAWDKEDGDISKNIKVSGKVNTLVSGIYSINYSITNSAGNTEIKTVQFYVI